MFKIGDKILLARKDRLHMSIMDDFLGKEYVIDGVHFNGYYSVAGLGDYIFDGTGFNLVKNNLVKEPLVKEKKKVVKKDKNVPKFQVGDRVKVLNCVLPNDAIPAGGLIGLDGEKFIGECFTISQLYPDCGNGVGYYFEEETGYNFVWDERFLKRVRKVKNIVPILAIPIIPAIPDLRSELNKLVEARPNIGICSYGKQLKSGKFQMHHGDCCHARIGDSGYIKGKEITSLALNIKRHYDVFNERSKGGAIMYKRYAEYILNYSPWSPCFHHYGIDNAIIHGVLMDVDKPIEELVGAAVALREGSEYSHKLPLFCDLLDNGYSGNVAYLLSSALTDSYQFRGLESSHKTLGGDMDVNLLFMFFKKGYIKQGLKPYREHNKGYLGISEWIAKSTINENNQINNVLRKGLKVKKAEKFGEKVFADKVHIYEYANELETLINNS